MSTDFWVLYYDNLTRKRMVYMNSWKNAHLQPGDFYGAEKYFKNLFGVYPGSTRTEFVRVTDVWGEAEAWQRSH